MHNVVVDIQSRDELRNVWTRDISKGGMFVATASPPPRGARLDIQLHTPDGPLMLKSEVVHVQQDGVGVQLTDLTKEVRDRIQQYIDGQSSKISTDLPYVGAEALDVLLDEARRISTAIDAGDLYGALQMTPVSTSESLIARIDRLIRRLSSAPSDSSPPKVERLNHAIRQLERAAHLFKNRLRRQHYDLTREAAASESPGKAAKLKHELGLAFLRRADYDNARRFLERAVSLEALPEYQMDAARAMIADASFDRDLAYEKARPLLLAAIRGLRSDAKQKSVLARCHYLLGRLMHDLAKIPEAEKQFAKAVGIDPKLTEAATELRLLRIRAKNKRPTLIELFARK
jgi:tetratricopeptide (TPR) repeat protein